ncbi:YigZ family protein [Mycoplasmopsis lipophila]|uniref:YigZ family protein n=1 Tax=Mycoplasmopsis lipophila TaxID=2117 RepID=UPI0038733A69
MFFYEIDKSKFYGYKFKDISKEEIKTKIDFIKKEHKKATHICYACLIKKDLNIEGITSNDREPKGTSSNKIREVLLLKEKYNTLIVIVRYYGGIKLGVGNLSRTYKNMTLWTLED